jgi:hypothetical protein
MISMQTGIAHRPESFARTVLAYWARSLRESLRRDPDRNYQAVVTKRHLWNGQLTAIDAEKLQGAWAQSRAARQKTGQDRGPKAEQVNISVLVAPYLAGPVTARSRSSLGETFPPFWIPAILRPDGRLLPDPEHLPFVPRALLAPPVSQRIRSPADPVAELKAYDASVSAMAVNRNEDWHARLHGAEEMFLAVHGQPASAWLPDGWQRHQPIVVLWDSESGFTQPLLPLVDEWLAAGKMPGCLMVAGIGLQREPTDPPADGLPQFGHVGATPLNAKQRDAVRAVRSLADGHVQAINGPPGTGKTSLLKSIVADAVVRAAVADDPPPVILLTSTNNQAVRNAASDFAVEGGENVPLLRRRWVPGLPQLAAYDVSQAAAEGAAGMMLLVPTRARIFAPGYAEEARAMFLRNYAAWRKSVQEIEGEVSLVAARVTLRRKLRDTAEKIRACESRGGLALRHLRDADVVAGKAAAAEVATRLAQAGSQQLIESAAELDKRADTVGAEQQHALEMLRQRTGLHPLWMRLCCPLKRVEAQRAALLHRAAVTLGYLDADAPGAASRAAVHDAVDAVFVVRTTAFRLEAANARAGGRVQLEAASTAQMEADRLRADLHAWAAADAEVRAWMAGWVDPHAADHLDAMQRRLDLGERALAFDLAMRLREAEFLIKAEDWDPAWAQGKHVKTRDLRPRLLQAVALLAPCIISTIYKAANYGCFFDGQNERPLSLPIDLLIYDEAGQVLPDHGLPLLGLARRAVAVGDIHQLEPIASFSDVADAALMSAAGADRVAQVRLREIGLDHAGGSVMRLFQGVTAYSESEGAAPGIMLRQHFRCVPRVIAYCNELVYRGQLVPLRSPIEAPSVPPMAWAHLRGDSRQTGTSWTNAPEAEAIARWIAVRRAAIEAEHGAGIAQLVAIITPYRLQPPVVRKALVRHLGTAAEGMTVGTVHALQGAQRRVVVFSPTITRTSVAATGTSPFFDTSSNMLNVAVSRAQDAFVVIGDMALFDEHPDAGCIPSAVLARHLRRHEDSELRDVIPGLAAAHPHLRFERIEGLAAHRAVLAEAFGCAQRRILLASPFLSAAAIEADQVLTMVADAAVRGVEVVIYTGLSLGSDVAGRGAEALQRRLVTAGARVHVTTRVHSKTLAVDEGLAVEGSFNWFSASRDPQFTRKESSIALRGSDAAEAVGQIEAEFAALQTVPLPPE